MKYSNFRLVDTYFFPQNNKSSFLSTKSSSERQKSSLHDKTLDKEYLYKLSVLLKTNDKQYKIKRKHLNELECKINKNNQEYLTGLNFNKKIIKNENDTKKDEKFFLYNDSENNLIDLNDETDIINNDSKNLLDENEKKLLYKKLRTKKNFYRKQNSIINNFYKPNSYSNLNISNSSINSNNNLIQNKSQILNFRNYKNNFEDLYLNAEKIIQKTKIIREFKNKTKIMDRINFFSYNKSKWNHHNLFKSLKMKIKPKTFLPEIFLKKIKNININEKSEENELKKIQKDVNKEIKNKQKENKIINKLKKHKLIDNTLDLMKEDIEKIDDLIFKSRQIYNLGFLKKNSIRKKK